MQKAVYDFISKKLGDPIAEWRTCQRSGKPFAIFQKDMEFYTQIGPTINGKKYPCLPPVLAPDERWRLKLSFRNNKKLYKRTCDYSGNKMVSMYKASSPYTVYHQDVWYTDVWNPMDYGQEIDRENPFFEQYQALLLDVPKMALINVRTENSQYANYISDAKNCYLSSIVYRNCENIYYSFWVMLNSKDVSDGYHCHRNQMTIGCTDCMDVFGSYYLHICSDTRSSLFSAYLQNCEHCIFCANLVNKQYCIYNKQVSKQEYMDYLQQMKADINFFKTGYEIFQQRLADAIVPGCYMSQCEASLGHDLQRCKECVMCVSSEDFENCRYSRGDTFGKNLRDVSGGGLEMALESINVGLSGTTHLIGCTSVLTGHHLYYCDNCYDNCSYCFACVGLRNKQYCIFNKQYGKKEYFDLVERLIQKMTDEGVRGHFPPKELSAFDYNETRAGEAYPLMKEEALQRGFTWYDEEGKQQIPESYIPLHISQYDADKVGKMLAEQNKQELLSATLVCEQSGKAFRIIPAELDLYIKMYVPIPRLHPDERYKELYMRRGKDFRFYMRQCASTGEEILSSYSEEEKLKVWSMEAFQEVMYT